jgi:hypothetical protein
MLTTPRDAANIPAANLPSEAVLVHSFKNVPAQNQKINGQSSPNEVKSVKSRNGTKGWCLF